MTTDAKEIIVQTVICRTGIQCIDDSVLFLAILEPGGNQLVHTLATSDAAVIPEDHFRLDSKNVRVCSHADFASSGAYRAPDGLAKA